MSIKIKHTDPTLNSFSTDDIVVNVNEGSLFFKSNTELFRVKGDIMSTAVTESFGDELWVKSGDNIFYPSEGTSIIEIGTNLTPSTQGSFPEVIISGSLAIRNTDSRIELDDTIGDKFRIQNQNGIFKIIQHSASLADNDILAVSGSRVGIGTETPDYELDVNGNIGVNQYIYHNDDPNTFINFTDDDINLTVAGKTAIDLTYDGSGGGDTREITFNEAGEDFDVRIEGDTDANLFFTDAGNNRVGIGTNTPAYKLDLGEEASTIRLVSENNGTAIRIGSGGTSNDVTLIRVDGQTSDHDGESDDSHFGFSLKYMGSRSGNANSLSIFSDAEQGTAVEALTVLQDGKVGIGKDAPSTKLDVNGTVTCTGFNNTSDINLKTNINNIETPLETIFKLRGITFDWKEHIIETDKTLQGTKHGLIAQEVEKIIPSLVQTNKNKSVSYFEIIPILVEAIKEQQNQINELKNKINE